MFDRVKRRWLRGLTGLVVAYALVIQAFLAGSVMAQAAAQNPSLDTGAFLVLCSQHVNDDGTAGDGAPAKTFTHCAMCTLAASNAALAPTPLELTPVDGIPLRRMSFVSTEACISFHQARAGLSRAPPQNA